MIRRNRRSRIWVESDPYWSHVELLMKMNGPNDGTSFVDSCLRPKTITAYGNARYSHYRSVFGGSSGWVDGEGDYIHISCPIDFGNAPWTIEFWYCPSARTNYGAILGCDEPDQPIMFYHGNSVCGGVPVVGVGPSSSVWFDNAHVSAAEADLSFGPVSNNVWYHFALVRDGDLFKTFKNGLLMSTGGVDSPGQSVGSFSTITLGKNGTHYLAAWFDELRITKGICRYASDFMVPTVEFPIG